MKVVIVGYGGMGKVLLEQISKVTNLELVGVVDVYAEIGSKTFNDLQVVPDVIIDFSHPSYLSGMLRYAKKHSCKLIVATTGYSETEELKIRDAAKDLAILRTSNTSLGVNIVLDVIRQVTVLLEQDYDIEIIEKHHNKKVDAPSGTAKMMLDEIIKSRTSNTTPVYGRNGVSKRNQNDVTIHSVRGGTIAGEHTVIYAGDDEIIEIKHTAMSKKVFANGAIKAAQFINQKTKGLFSMKDVLEETQSNTEGE